MLSIGKQRGHEMSNDQWAVNRKANRDPISSPISFPFTNL